MLFDLRARGRRRTVQAVYLGLAILFGLGFVGFGVGGGFGGGGVIEGLLGGKEGANSASFSAQIEKYEKLTRKQPNDVYAWEQLTLARLHEAGGEAYVTSAGLTSRGRELFTQTAQSWNSYIALNPPKPNVEVAQEMVRIFGEEGLNQPAEAVNVLQIVIPAKSASPPQYQASLYASLAAYAYKASNPREGDLASQKAVSLSPTAQRATLKTRLEAIKKNPTGGASGEASTSGSSGQTVQVKTGSAGAAGSAGSSTTAVTTSTKKK